jgi:hypothetical protein
MPIVKEIKQHKILLDTHVWIWLAQGNSILSPSARKAIDRARGNDHLFISPISVWEISMLVERKKIILEMDIMDWLKQPKQPKLMLLHRSGAISAIPCKKVSTGCFFPISWHPARFLFQIGTSSLP